MKLNVLGLIVAATLLAGALGLLSAENFSGMATSGTIIVVVSAFTALLVAVPMIVEFITGPYFFWVEKLVGFAAFVTGLQGVASFSEVLATVTSKWWPVPLFILWTIAMLYSGVTLLLGDILRKIVRRVG